MDLDLEYEPCCTKFKPASNKRARQDVHRSIVALRWLASPIHWRNGRLGWLVDGDFFYPGPADLSKAAAHLEKIHRAASARRRIEDYRSWRALHLSLLAQARLLLDRSSPDLAQLCSSSRARNPRALERLAGLLALEAVVAEPLPSCPSLALLQAWPLPATSLQSTLADQHEPMADRALTAMLLGAATALEKLPALPGDPWLRRCMFFGREHGLTVEPALACTLLKTGTIQLVAEIIARTQNAEPFNLSLSVIRIIARDGKTAPEISQLQLTAACIGELLSPLSFVPPAAHGNLNPEVTRLRKEWSAFRDELATNLRPVVEHVALRGGTGALAKLDGFIDILIRNRIGADATVQIPPAKLRRRKQKEASWKPALSAIATELLRPFQSILESTDVDKALDVMLEIAGKLRVRQEEEPCTPIKWTRKWQQWVEVDTIALRPVCTMAGRTDWDTALRAYRLGVLQWAHYDDLPRPWLDVVFDLAQWCGCNPDSQFDCNFVWMCENCGPAPVARQLLRPMLAAVHFAPVESRKDIVRRIIDAIGDRNSFRANWAILRTVIHIVADFNVTFPVDSPYDWVECALKIGEWRQRLNNSDAMPEAEIVSFYRSLMRVCELSGKQARAWDDGAMKNLVQILCTLPIEDESAWEKLLAAGMQHQDLNALSDWQPEHGLNLLHRHPWIQFAILHNFQTQPKRCLNLISDLFVVGAMSDVVPEVMQKFRQSECRLIDAKSPWRPLLDLDSSLLSRVHTARYFLSLRNEPDIPPVSAQRAVELPQKLARELCKIAELAESPTAPRHLQDRARNLNARLADINALRQNQVRMLHDALDDFNGETALRLVEASVDDCSRARLRKLAIHLPADMPLTDDLRNAALLVSDIECNRKWLHAVLRSNVAGDETWLRNLPGNRKFLDGLEAHSVNVNSWLSPHAHTIHSDKVGPLHIAIENDPIKILQMGNPFNTCLSQGGCNSFSTVSNAVELNKRVVYARDCRGRIVARQLWALSEENKLLGFRIYSNFSANQHEALVHHLNQFAYKFALECGLKLSNVGEVPTLFVRRWYDDGVVPWQHLGEHSEYEQPI